MALQVRPWTSCWMRGARWTSRLPLGLRNSPARFYISCCHVSFRLFSEAGLAGHCAEQARLLAPGSNLLQQLLRTARPSVLCLLLPLTCAGRAAANHGRSPLFPEGNKGFQFVRTGNCLAARVALLLRYIAAVHGRPRQGACLMQFRISLFFAGG